MKRFFKIDYYVQAFTLISILILLPFIYTITPRYFLLLYFIAGMIQLFSYVLRLTMRYRKSILFKLYGWSILPVWAALFTGWYGYVQNSDFIICLCLFILIAALFYSPVMAILYVLDCRRVYKASVYRIQKFLQLVNK